MQINKSLEGGETVHARKKRSRHIGAERELKLIQIRMSKKCGCGCLVSQEHRTGKSQAETARVPVVIATTVPTEEIKRVDDTPADMRGMETYKYNCPICLRYYNSTECCDSAFSHPSATVLQELRLQGVSVRNHKQQTAGEGPARLSDVRQAD